MISSSGPQQRLCHHRFRHQASPPSLEMCKKQCLRRGVSDNIQTMTKKPVMVKERAESHLYLSSHHLIPHPKSVHPLHTRGSWPLKQEIIHTQHFQSLTKMGSWPSSFNTGLGQIFLCLFFHFLHLLFSSGFPLSSSHSTTPPNLKPHTAEWLAAALKCQDTRCHLVFAWFTCARQLFPSLDAQQTPT